jgi:hypothetical protein
LSLDPVVIAAVIAAIAGLASALLSGMTQYLFRRHREDQNKLRANLETALKDIEFLLKVEQRHCELHKERDDESNKNRVRDLVRQTSGLHWSGKFVPSQAKLTELQASTAVTEASQDKVLKSQEKLKEMAMLKEAAKNMATANKDDPVIAYQWLFTNERIDIKRTDMDCGPRIPSYEMTLSARGREENTNLFTDLFEANSKKIAARVKALEAERRKSLPVPKL